MNHYEQGLAAFRARQFLEAQVHFERAAKQIPAEEETNYLRYLYECKKVLTPETCWRDLRTLAIKLSTQQKWHDVLILLKEEERFVPTVNCEFLYKYRCQAYFINGSLEHARENAIRHVDLLLKKKIYHQLAEYAETYQKWFPYMAYFVFFRLEAKLAFSDYQQTENCIQELVEMMHRRWTKLEDNESSSKYRLLETAYESIQQQDQMSGELVIQGHYVYLHSLLVQGSPLTKDDWKKVLEILVYDDSWKNLKLALELSLSQKEEELAQAILKHMKSKKGYSVVKLTKYDPLLKTWAMAKKEESLSGEQPASILTAEDLRLDGQIKNVEATELGTDGEEENEQKAIEHNAIKHLTFNPPSWENLLDILIAYKTMGFKRVVNFLFNEADKLSDSPLSFKKKISYMKVVHALDCNQRFLALSVLEEMLGSDSIELDEFKEFKYVQGSILLSLGEKVQARTCFAEVAKLDPEYRQLKDRMSRLETN